MPPRMATAPKHRRHNLADGLSPDDICATYYTVGNRWRDRVLGPVTTPTAAAENSLRTWFRVA